MAGWHLLEKVIDKLGRHSTLTGKYWFLSCLVLRLLMWMVVVNEVFAPGASKPEDKKSELECDTNTPGCEMICTNYFYKFNPAWYWAFQMLFTCLPMVVTTVFFDHKLDGLVTAKQLQRQLPIDRKNFFKKRLAALKMKIETDQAEGIESYKSPHGGVLDIQDIEEWVAKEEKRLAAQEDFEQLATGTEKRMESQRHQLEKVAQEYGFLLDKATNTVRHGSEIPSKLYLAYTCMAFFRCAIETAFLVGYFYIYPFALILPEKFYCDLQPCNNVAVCYVEKPIEKSIAMMLMVATSFISILIGVVELVHLLQRTTYDGRWEFGAALTRRHTDLTKLYKPGDIKSFIPTLHQLRSNSFMFDSALTSLNSELKPTWDSNMEVRQRKPNSDQSY